MMDALVEPLLWCLQHFSRMDEANAAIHCAPVRYSPITFRLAQALESVGIREGRDVERVLADIGVYTEDPGR